MTLKLCPFRMETLYNVMDYGAHADGLTDDQDHIQAAVDACAAAGGGTVYLPAGSYRLYQPHTVNSDCGAVIELDDNVQVRGAGESQTLVSFDYASSATAFAASGKSNMGLTYMSILVRNTSGNATKFYACSRVNFDHLSVGGLHKAADATTIAATNPATNEEQDYVLANELIDDHNTHIGSTTYHYQATDAVTHTDASDEGTLVTLANVLRSALGAHYADTVGHWGPRDIKGIAYVGATTIATNAATARTLVNALTVAHQNHLVWGQTNSGLSLAGCNNSTISGCEAYHCNNIGITANQNVLGLNNPEGLWGVDCTITDCESWDCNGRGFSAYGQQLTATYPRRMGTTSFIRCYTHDSPQQWNRGFWHTYCTHVNMVDCHADDSYVYNVALGGVQTATITNTEYTGTGGSVARVLHQTDNVSPEYTNSGEYTQYGASGVVGVDIIETGAH